MARQIINIGTTPNDGTGDTVRNAFDKVNDNFDEVYNGLFVPLSGTTEGNDVTGQVTFGDDVPAVFKSSNGADDYVAINGNNVVIQGKSSDDVLQSMARVCFGEGTESIIQDIYNYDTGRIAFKYPVLDPTDDFNVNWPAKGGTVAFLDDVGVDELNELHDVAISSPINNNILSYNSSLQRWENKTISKVDGLSLQSGIDNLEYISNLIHRQGLSYAMCNINTATYLTFRTNVSVVQLGNSAFGGTPPRIAYTSAATAGSLTFQRGTIGGVAGSNWWYSRKFEITCNISDSRFVCGLSNQFQLATPTNVEPDTLINIAGVCKLSTSNNLHFFHNDGSGLATTVDLGTNYPANNATAYTYLLELERDGTSTLYFKLTRTDTSGNKISTTYTTNTNYAGLASSVIYGTNNATASAFSFNDYGILIKNREDQWNTL